ncbi:GNAT family N-acetyltransferase [Aneurinibacillus tyrosinisolvens]|uniref:GNAT family N-acetyltransferase n=1 Tax=Aneurinibacillus tyrosinisolvens TaxID=1443435 RepID=UPI00063F2041|nr:N-acetyltransferase [Aneurinibacillus tyrosinisolvens]
MEQIVKLRPTTSEDLDFVLCTENHPENCPYIFQWTKEQHKLAIENPNVAHFIVERATDSVPVGYVILLGIEEIHQSIELTRTAFAEKGKGYGRQMLRLIKKWAFKEKKANRLWLEVIDHNTRAKQLYLSEGFVEEGLKREAVKFQGKLESIFVLSILSREYAEMKDEIRLFCV